LLPVAPRCPPRPARKVSCLTRLCRGGFAMPHGNQVAARGPHEIPTLGALNVHRDNANVGIVGGELEMRRLLLAFWRFYVAILLETVVIIWFWLRNPDASVFTLMLALF